MSRRPSIFAAICPNLISTAPTDGTPFYYVYVDELDGTRTFVKSSSRERDIIGMGRTLAGWIEPEAAEIIFGVEDDPRWTRFG